MNLYLKYLNLYLNQNVQLSVVLVDIAMVVLVGNIVGNPDMVPETIDMAMHRDIVSRLDDIDEPLGLYLGTF